MHRFRAVGKQVDNWVQRAPGGEEITVTFRGRPRVRLMPIIPRLLEAP
ncbi:MAG TPA: hypothetical protein VG405_08060 [Solirubrobacteraceae bacterium]|nr:hypothetical protein [Solirubrobacteraceae bacterium]